MILDLASCAVCGVYPWDAPLGEFCDDENLHDFGHRTEEVASPSPAASSVGCPGHETFGSDRPGRPA